jgi:hypothetical protein
LALLFLHGRVILKKAFERCLLIFNLVGIISAGVNDIFLVFFFQLPGYFFPGGQ